MLDTFRGGAYNRRMYHSLLVSLLDRLSLPDLAALVARGARDASPRIVAELGNARLDGTASHEAAAHFATRAVVAWANGNESIYDSGLAMALLDEAEELCSFRPAVSA